MLKGPEPEGVSPSQALGGERANQGRRMRASEFHCSHTCPALGTLTLLSSPACPMPFVFSYSQILQLTLTSQPRGWWEGFWPSGEQVVRPGFQAQLGLSLAV